MKVAKKIAPQSYSLNNIGSLLGKRPFSTIENLCESMVSQRHKSYVPKDIDLVEYDKHLLKKQLDLEIMRIEVDVTTALRKVTRERNEEGMFTRLMGELRVIAK